MQNEIPELGPLDIVALMDSLDRARHIAVLDCDADEVAAAEWCAEVEG